MPRDTNVIPQDTNAIPQAMNAVLQDTNAMRQGTNAEHRGTGGHRAIVVANGALPDLGPFLDLLAAANMVVAADGGARALLRTGHAVDTILGDFDSLDEALLVQWRSRGGHTMTFPTEKDETDLELALRYVVELGANRVVILGALGGRLDHELANLFLLAAPLLDSVEAEILDPRTRVVAIRASATLPGKTGDLLSLLPVTARVEGITTDGLAYALAGEPLELGPSRGVSNIFTGDQARVAVTSGVLLAIQTWSDDRLLHW